MQQKFVSAVSLWICLIFFCNEILMLKNRVMVHVKSRKINYPFKDVKRLVVLDAQVPWSQEYNYSPPEFNAPFLDTKPWADPPIENVAFKPKFNELDGNIDRRSHTKIYEIVDKRPINPEGRTGLKGRGILGRWGPNHAADPIVTRWKLVNGSKVFHKLDSLPILQFCAIQRKDNNEWAIPGGMVDPGEAVSETLRREFLEEAMDSLEFSLEQAEKNKAVILDFFNHGIEIYKGYVDDPRNTDNSWMETVAMNFHDDTGNIVGKFNLKAGDDAKNVRWMDIDLDMDVDKGLNLYASHSHFIELVAKVHGAHW